jgi:hypothetical protein
LNIFLKNTKGVQKFDFFVFFRFIKRSVKTCFFLKRSVKTWFFKKKQNKRHWKAGTLCMCVFFSKKKCKNMLFFLKSKTKGIGKRERCVCVCVFFSKKRREIKKIGGQKLFFLIIIFK